MPQSPFIWCFSASRFWAILDSSVWKHWRPSQFQVLSLCLRWPWMHSDLRMRMFPNSVNSHWDFETKKGLQKQELTSAWAVKIQLQSKANLVRSVVLAPGSLPHHRGRGQRSGWDLGQATPGSWRTPRTCPHWRSKRSKSYLGICRGPGDSEMFWGNFRLETRKCFSWGNLDFCHAFVQVATCLVCLACTCVFPFRKAKVYVSKRFLRKDVSSRSARTAVPSTTSRGNHPRRRWRSRASHGSSRENRGPIGPKQATRKTLDFCFFVLCFFLMICCGGGCFLPRPYIVFHLFCLTLISLLCCGSSACSRKDANSFRTTVLDASKLTQVTWTFFGNGTTTGRSTTIRTTMTMMLFRKVVCTSCQHIACDQ